MLGAVARRLRHRSSRREIDAATGAHVGPQLLERGVSPARVAFADLGGTHQAWTGDRGSSSAATATSAAPAALAGAAALSGAHRRRPRSLRRAAAHVDLAAGESVEVVFFLGQASRCARARELVARYRAADLDAVLAQVTRHWEELLGAVQVKTPDRAMDIMLNGWLLYQTLACRIWARSAFYQASGAYGFRDQLQDGMALACRPAAGDARAPAARRRPAVRRRATSSTGGCRTPARACARASPTTASGWPTRPRHYVGDDRRRGACSTRRFRSSRARRWRRASTTRSSSRWSADQPASLFEHCARGLDQCLALTGRHGLPLIGTGDWNDGMNRVGEGGQGESVWLGWFLLRDARAVRAPGRAARRRRRAPRAGARTRPRCASALEREAWDGAVVPPRLLRRRHAARLERQRRMPDRLDRPVLGRDLSGAADPARAAARDGIACDEQLVRRRRRPGAALHAAVRQDARVDPGYIKGYPPGIRENGGQYTHAAIWVVMAFALLGRGRQGRGTVLDCSTRSTTRRRAARVQRYKVEPYVVAADVYSAPPHVGRGGWTWYTGSAGWMYRAGIEGHPGYSPRRQRPGDRALHSARVAGLRSPGQRRRYPLRYPGGLAIGTLPRYFERAARWRGHARLRRQGVGAAGRRKP